MQGLTLRPRGEGDAGRDPARAAPSDGLPASPGAPALRVRTQQPSRLGKEAAGSAAEAAASPHGPSPRERNAFFSADPPPAPPPLDLDLDQDQGGPSLLGPSPPPPPPSTGPRRSGMRTRTSLGGGGAPKPRRDVCFAAAIEDVALFSGSPKRAYQQPTAADVAAADAEDAAEAAATGADAAAGAPPAP